VNVNRKTLTVVAASAALLLGGVTACRPSSLTGGGGFKDLEHVNPQDPDKAILINNVDGFPNITIVCVGGVALVTTTREAAGALQHFAELDHLCPGYVRPVGG
jgi:hypothetical protein